MLVSYSSYSHVGFIPFLKKAHTISMVENVQWCNYQVKKKKKLKPPFFLFFFLHCENMQVKNCNTLFPNMFYTLKNKGA